MSKGWVSLHRKIRSHWLWREKPFSKGQAFVDLLLMANHTAADVLFRDSLYRVEAGQFITSELKLAAQWGWSRDKVRRFLTALAKAGTINRKTTSRMQQITIVNWSIYQKSETGDDTGGDTRGTIQETIQVAIQETNINNNETIMKQQ